MRLRIIITASLLLGILAPARVLSAASNAAVLPAPRSGTTARNMDVERAQLRALTARRAALVAQLAAADGPRGQALLGALLTTADTTLTHDAELLRLARQAAATSQAAARRSVPLTTTLTSAGPDQLWSPAARAWSPDQLDGTLSAGTRATTSRRDVAPPLAMSLVALTSWADLDPSIATAEPQTASPAATNATSGDASYLIPFDGTTAAGHGALTVDSGAGAAPLAAANPTVGAAFAQPLPIATGLAVVTATEATTLTEDSAIRPPDATQLSQRLAALDAAVAQLRALEAWANANAPTPAMTTTDSISTTGVLDKHIDNWTASMVLTQTTPLTAVASPAPTPASAPAPRLGLGFADRTPSFAPLPDASVTAQASATPAATGGMPAFALGATLALTAAVGGDPSGGITLNASLGAQGRDGLAVTTISDTAPTDLAANLLDAPVALNQTPTATATLSASSSSTPTTASPLPSTAASGTATTLTPPATETGTPATPISTSTALPALSPSPDATSSDASTATGTPSATPTITPTAAPNTSTPTTTAVTPTSTPTATPPATATAPVTATIAPVTATEAATMTATTTATATMMPTTTIPAAATTTATAAITGAATITTTAPATGTSSPLATVLPANATPVTGTAPITTLASLALSAEGGSPLLTVTTGVSSTDPLTLVVTLPVTAARALETPDFQLQRGALDSVLTQGAALFAQLQVSENNALQTYRAELNRIAALNTAIEQQWDARYSAYMRYHSTYPAYVRRKAAFDAYAHRLHLASIQRQQWQQRMVAWTRYAQQLAAYRAALAACVRPPIAPISGTTPLSGTTPGECGALPSRPVPPVFPGPQPAPFAEQPPAWPGTPPLFATNPGPEPSGYALPLPPPAVPPWDGAADLTADVAFNGAAPSVDPAGRVETTQGALLAAGALDGGLSFQDPIKGIITTYWGGQTIFQSFHTGVDIAAPMYTPIHAAATGRVVWAGYAVAGQRHESYGLCVVIQHNAHFSTLYAHMDDQKYGLMVRVGDTVQQGQVIGYVGMTGWTTGPHLHFEMRDDNVQFNPLLLIPNPQD